MTTIAGNKMQLTHVEPLCLLWLQATSTSSRGPRTWQTLVFFPIWQLSEEDRFTGTAEDQYTTRL